MTVGRMFIHLDTDIADDPDDVCVLALLCCCLGARCSWTFRVVNPSEWGSL
ncbi:MAG TPA: hypothetical protein VF858_00880 [Gemmatimonadaceae bacterium]